MKLLKVTFLIAALSAAATLTCKAQDYAKIEYWGKTYPIDQTFFQIINSNYDQYMNGPAKTYRWYDYRDYNDIYVKMIDRLKDPKFAIIVTEANQIMLRNTSIIFPGTEGEPGRKKKSMARAEILISEVVKPTLEQYVNNYKRTHQFQY